MSSAPLMPMATAVWLVENTTLTFKQIAEFCKLHEVEVQGIADGEVAKGIKAYNPIISGQLSREEINLSSKDQNRPLEIKSTDIQISNTYKNLNIEIYDTPFKKEFHCNNHKKCGNLSHNNVNSGLSYLNNIVIFRREEMLKLLIHELIHALDIDNKYETIQDKKKILELYNINNTNFLVNESYVETWAVIINIFLVLHEKKMYKTKEEGFILFRKYIKKEIIHSFQQCSKLCKFYNIDDFNKIYRRNKNTIKYTDGVNTFSYHIIKTINLNNINNFIKNFCDNTYILPKRYNFNRYTLFVIKYNETIINKINYILAHTEKKTKLRGLTMSSVN